MSLLLSWLVLSCAVWLTALVLPGFQVRGALGSVVVAAIFGTLHFFIGWLLFAAIGIGTLGLGFLLAFLTRFLVSAIVLKLTDALTDRLTIKSFGTAFLGALLMSAFGTLGEFVVRAAL